MLASVQGSKCTKLKYNNLIYYKKEDQCDNHYAV